MNSMTPAWRGSNRNGVMRRLLWLCACLLVAKAGCVATAAAYDRNELISYIRCNAWRVRGCCGSSRGYRTTVPKRVRSTHDHHQRRSGERHHSWGRNDLRFHWRRDDIILAGMTVALSVTAAAVADFSSKDTFRREAPRLALVSWRRGRRGRGAISTVAVTSASSDANEKSLPVEGRIQEVSEKVLPGSRPSKGAENQDEAAIKYANDGDWKKALQLIKAMRDGDLKPSVTAYVATIEACRKELFFDYATALLRDMFRVCMPEDLFAEFAPNHPNDAEVTQTERVFALLLMMREDGVSPVQETYRAIMGLCSKEGLWHLSLLLLDHLRRSGLVPGKFVWDEICTVLFKTGHAEMATMMFEMALEENVSGEETTGVSNGLLDLHNHTASTALAAVRIALLDMVRKPAGQGYHDPMRPLSVVTGMGNNSKDGEAVIKPQVMDLLTALGLEPKLMRNNEGCIVLQSDALQGYVTRLTSGANKTENGPKR